MRVIPRRFVYSSILLLLCGVACTSTSPDSVPTATPESLVLFDDYVSPSPNWALFDTEDGAAYTYNEELYLEDRGKGIAIYSPLLKQTYEDVSISVEARYVQGSMNNWMGVICRQQDEANYYVLAISADGYYLIQRVVDNEILPLGGPTMSEAIEVGKAKNILVATCQGNTLSLRVNDELLVSRTDSTLGVQGQVALFADAVELGGTTLAAFDDFTLSIP